MQAIPLLLAETDGVIPARPTHHQVQEIDPIFVIRAIATLHDQARLLHDPNTTHATVVMGNRARDLIRAI